MSDHTSRIKAEIAAARAMITTTREDLDRIEIFCSISEPTPNDTLLMMRSMSDANDMQPLISVFEQVFALLPDADAPASPEVADVVREAFRSYLVTARLQLAQFEAQMDATERHPALRDWS